MTFIVDAINWWGAPNRIARIRSFFLRSPPDPAMDALNAQIAFNRRHHRPNRDVLAAKRALVHERLRGRGEGWKNRP